MRIIQKEISLEPMTSRLPSVWPSYLNNKLYYFDEETLSGRSYQYTSNWGMIPMNIVINQKPSSSHTSDEYSIIFGQHCYGGNYATDNGCSIDYSYSYDKLGGFVLSFENLSHWYHFFTEYYNLLKRYGHCNRVYTSAEDYYNYESLTKYADQMIYGTDKQTYLDLDAEFAYKGGKVEVLVFDKDHSEYLKKTPIQAHDETENDRMAMVDVYDIGFFKWICDNVVPSFTVPMRYRDYWKVDVMYYPDVVKWLAWFKAREGKNYTVNAHFEKGENGELDSWQCKTKTVDDCCDCEEFFNRGGDEMYSALTIWYDEVQRAINFNKSIIEPNECYFIPTVILPTELQLSIDDLGEFSIFSKDYELGLDYRVADGMEATNNTESGTVITIDGKPMMLASGYGYAFNETYMQKYVSRCEDCGYEGVFTNKCPKCGSEDIIQISYDSTISGDVENAWIDYTEHYINDSGECRVFDNRKDFYVSAYTYYTYDENNVKYYASGDEMTAKESLKSQLAKKYPLNISENGWILIDNNLYAINSCEYGIYDSSNTYLGNKKYIIYREDITNTPYTYINGKQIYGEFDAVKQGFFFPFFKDNGTGSTTFYKRLEIGDEMLFVIYNDSAYEVINNTSTLEIDGIEYYRISGHATDDSSNELYLTYDNEVRSGDTMELIEDVSIEVGFDDVYLVVQYPYDFRCIPIDVLKGRTVSKLSDLRLYDVLVDDVGNSIDGIYPIVPSTLNAVLKNFQPPQGTSLEPLYQVGNTANIKRFSQTSEKNGIDTNYFVGDIITEMLFYYKEYDGSIPYQTKRRVSLNRFSNADIYKINENGEWEAESQDISGYTSLSAISKSTDEKELLEKSENEVHVFYDDIFCDITYYVGATLSRAKGQKFIASFASNLNNHGVEYKETVRFVKENREYYRKKRPRNFLKAILPSKRNDVSAHSISYPIFVYKMTQELEHVDNSQYDTSYKVPMADFSTQINIFNESGDTYSEKFSKDMEHHNGLRVFPTFREEYRMGISTIENVNSNIYIDRGINSAFERHLKLGEVTSLESLEQFGNGYFKIMNS